MDWPAIGVGVTVAIALLGANAWLMKMVLKGELSATLLAIEREFVTKEEFNRHIDNCPAKNKD